MAPQRAFKDLSVMQTVVNLRPLIGVLVIVVGFVLRFNPLLVVTAAAIATGLAAHFPLEKILASMGEGFLQTRALQLILLLPLAVIGLLERHGLRLHAQNWIARFERATVGRLLIIYLFVRESTAAMGLPALAAIRKWCGRCWRPWPKGRRRNATASCRTGCATKCWPCVRQPITSGCFSVKTSLSRLVRARGCTPACWVRGL